MGKLLTYLATIIFKGISSEMFTKNVEYYTTEYLFLVEKSLDT